MKRITKTELVFFVIFFLGLVAVFKFNMIAGGTITSPRDLAEGLASPPDAPQLWSIQDWSTVKYRALFRLIVQGTWSLLAAPNDAWSFYVIFVAWSFIFYYAALVTFYFFLRELNFDSKSSFIGGLLFLILPPVLLAYKYPIYTREDPLAFFLVVLGLLAIFRSNLLAICVIALAAALTRETTLIMPLAFVVAAKQPLWKRLLVGAVPVAALIGIRLAWGNTVPDSLNSSILNFVTPFETIAFLFCAFGALWLPYVSNLIQRWQKADAGNYAWHIIISSAPIVLALVIISTLAISRAREIRITYILFPWAIPLALDWFRRNASYLQSLWAKWSYRIFACGVFGFVALVGIVARLTQPDLMRAYLADFVNGYWLVLGAIHLSITLAIFLPMLRSPRYASEITKASEV